MRASPAIRVRAARSSDLDRVFELETLCFPDPWPRSAFESELDGDTPMWVAVCGRRLAGYVCRFPGVDEVHISNVAVHPDFRRRGVARRLIEECIRSAAVQGIPWLYLEVRPSNEAARALYESLGFVEIYRRREYYIRPPEDGLVLGRQIQLAEMRSMRRLKTAE